MDSYQIYHIIIMLIGGFVLSAVFTYMLIPMLYRLKAGQSIRDEGPKSHMAKSGTPTMGGIAIVLASFVISIAVVGLNYKYIIIFIGFVLFASLGFLDDFLKVKKKQNLGLTAIQKLIFQIVIAVGSTLYYIKTVTDPTEVLVPFLDKNWDMGILFLPFSVFVIVAMANSVNLTDGLDGLAAGTVAIVSIAIGIIAFITKSAESYLFLFGIAGSCLGFLLFNKNPAKVFMGDTGSLALGGGIAIATLFMRGELFLPIICMVFMLETLSVMIQVVSFKLTGKRVFKMAPLHHHFELSGLREKCVVKLFYGFTLICSVMGVFIFIVFS